MLFIALFIYQLRSDHITLCKVSTYLTICMCYNNYNVTTCILIEMTEYIVSLAVIYGKNASALPGYTKIDVDLNKGAGGQYIYLCYKKNASEPPITGINVFAESSEDFPIQSGYSKVPGDLNKGAGGKYIYVCYTKDESLPPISAVNVIFGDRAIYPDAQYVRIDQDCNESAGGKYIYICYHQPRFGW